MPARTKIKTDNVEKSSASALCVIAAVILHADGVPPAKLIRFIFRKSVRVWVDFLRIMPKNTIDAIITQIHPLANWIELEQILDCTKNTSDIPHPITDNYGRGLHTFAPLDAGSIKSMLFSDEGPRAVIWSTSPAATLMYQKRGSIWAVYLDKDRARTKKFKTVEIARRFVVGRSKGVDTVCANVVKTAR